MKKFLLFVVIFTTAAFVNKTIAQCTVTNVRIGLVSQVPNGGGCTITANVSFDISANSGNKFIWFHTFVASNYPSPSSFNPGGASSPCANGQTPAINPPTAATLAGALLNIGLTISGAGATATIAQLTTYGPAPAVSVNTTYTPSISFNSAAGTYTITLSNLVVNSPVACGTALATKTDLWSSNSNASSAKAQCYICGIASYFNNPNVVGNRKCVIPVVYQLIFSNIDPVNSVTVTGWDTYLDDNANGIFEAGVDPIVDSYTTPPIVLAPNQTVPTTYRGFTGNSDPAKRSKTLFSAVHVAGSNDIVATIVNTCGALPVKFASFTAQQAAGKVTLNWQTAAEYNNKEFEIQRRIGAGSFQTIATVASKALNGNSGFALNYSYDDVTNLVGAGQVYYRIKQVDIDGHSDYSEIRSIRNNAKNFSITIYPNPGHQPKITVPDGAGIVDISVSDMTGKEVQHWNATSLKGFQLMNLRPGMYTIRVNVKETGDVLVDKVIIQ